MNNKRKQCPTCGYARKADEVALDDKCPSCEEVYAKMQQQGNASMPKADEIIILPSSRKKPSSSETKWIRKNLKRIANKRHSKKKKISVILTGSVIIIFILIMADTKPLGEKEVKENLAWHALNTFGWDCPKITSKGEINDEGYFYIKCSSGMRLRVYPRIGTHPTITNKNGGHH